MLAAATRPSGPPGVGPGGPILRPKTVLEPVAQEQFMRVASLGRERRAAECFRGNAVYERIDRIHIDRLEETRACRVKLGILGCRHVFEWVDGVGFSVGSQDAIARNVRSERIFLDALEVLRPRSGKRVALLREKRASQTVYGRQVL